MSTTDHILKFKELINHNKTDKKNTYITFLDVTKAYDKAWLGNCKQYRIQFGQEKSKLLIIGKDNTNPTIKLGDMPIDPSETYKYLGETLNTKNNINDHIRLNYATTLLIKNPDNLRETLQATNPKSWIQKTIQQARSVELDLYTLRHIPAKDRKTLLKETITKSMNGKLNTEGQNKSKFKFLTTNGETRSSGTPFYLYKLPKEQARAIFMARTRMIKVKTNYKNMHPNTICWGCGQPPTNYSPMTQQLPNQQPTN